MLKLCLVKQNTCYDLFTLTGPNLKAIVESSNWRSGPIGLWEHFDCDAKIVKASLDPECNVGKKLWESYVTGWDIWPEGRIAEDVEDIDWSVYDIVIAVDVAVPKRIVIQFPQVMWCYYFVEGGPLGIDTIFQGSPFYGYNVFLNHKNSKQRLTTTSIPCLAMRKNKRAVLDFPYYLQSSRTIRNLYEWKDSQIRSGIVLGHHSYPVISAEEKIILNRYGGVREGYKKISDIHLLELKSKYFIIHPNSKPSAGLALVEAISAGCLALAPRKKLWGFPELIPEILDYENFDQLVNLLERLEADPNLLAKAKNEQADMVDRWFSANPIANLETLYDCFKKSQCGVIRQWVSEKSSFVYGRMQRLKLLLSKCLKIVS